jgi:hypothetical protein
METRLKKACKYNDYDINTILSIPWSLLDLDYQTRTFSNAVRVEEGHRESPNDD